MVSKHPPGVANDFSAVQSFLLEKGIIPKNAPASLIQTARRIHISTYSLILWRFRLRGLPKHGSVFVEEIASDALQVLPQVMMGFGKSATLLTRGIIENALRHSYFLDHPIEFHRMNREAKWFMTVEALIEYGKNHPIFFDIGQRYSVFNLISSLYSELSAAVHGRRVSDLEMRTALSRISYDQSAATKHADAIVKAAEMTNFVLAMLHRPQMEKFESEDKSVILRSMPAVARSLWREHESN